MLDNALTALIISTLESGLTAIGLSFEVVADYQPTQQGTPSAPTIFLYKIGPDIRIGGPERISQQGTGAASFTGSITGSVLTVSSLKSGTVESNQGLIGANITTNLIVLSQINGTIGGVGTYQLNQAPAAPIKSQAIQSAGTWVYTETQQYASTFQISALATQDPKNPGLTASDIVNYAGSILESQTSIELFEAQQVGILRIAQSRNPYFTDDRVRYEASPSMDFTLTHQTNIITSIPVVSAIEFELLDV